MSSLYELPDLPAAQPVPAAPRQRLLRAVPDPGPLDFEAAVRRLTPQLQRYATRRLGDRHEAEELVQEALLRAYDHRNELATEDDLAAWSTCVTGRLVIDRLRVRGRSQSFAEVPEGTRVGRDTADVVVARDEARTALDALDAMPARQAAVLWAREVEGLAYEEIGTRFGMTEPAVRSTLSRARKTLRREFATRGGTLPAAGLIALAPWVDGLSWLERLRKVAARTAAPTMLGVVGLSALGGLLAIPWSSSLADGAARPAVDVTQVSVAREVLEGRQAMTAVAVRPAAVAPRAVASKPVAAAADAVTIVRRIGVSTTCARADGSGASVVGGGITLEQTALPGGMVPVGESGAGGRDCQQAELHSYEVGPELVENPTGVRQIAVEQNRLDCSDLVITGVTKCFTSEGESR